MNNQYSLLLSSVCLFIAASTGHASSIPPDSKTADGVESALQSTRHLFTQNVLLLASSVLANAPGTDPVPGAIERMNAYPGLEQAVRLILFANNIPGHNAARIDIDVTEDGSRASIAFIMPSGANRIVACIHDNSAWECIEQS
ncbi:MAG: hypothetical protein AAGA40_06960 [Cyanobacteria bacterium P01_E01_bin.45]